MGPHKFSRTGFGLVEVLVVIGLMAIISLGTITVISNMQKGVSSAQKSADRTDTMKAISTALSNKDTCNLAMGAGTLAIPVGWVSGTATPITINRISVGTEVLAETGVVINNIRTRAIRLEKISGPFPVQYNIAASGATPNLRNYNRYFTSLIVTPEKAGGAANNVGGESLKDSEFRLAILVSDTNSLVDCFGGIEESDLQALCEKAFEGQYDASRYPWCQVNNLSIGIHRAALTAQYPRFAVLEKQNGAQDLTMALYGSGVGSSNGPGLWFANSPATGLSASGSLGVLGYANRNDAYITGSRAGDLVMRNLSNAGDIILGTFDNQIRLRQTARQVDFNQGISISASTVGPVAASRHPLSVHSPDGQSRIVITGASDAGQTYSAIYLGNNIPNSALTNSWVLAHKANPTEFDQFHINRWFGGVMSIGLVISPAMNVGLGTSTPTERLDVNGNTVVAGTLRVGTNTTVGGNITAGGIITAASDRRLKKDITVLDDSLEKILKLRPVSFHWKDSSRPEKEIGFVAQEVEAVIPEVVRTGPEGIKAIAYGNIVAMAVGAIEKLKELFDIQDSRVAQLEKQMGLLAENQKRLEKKNQELEEKVKRCSE